ncbi:MAG: hypothetical protein AB7F59_03080 [Bdellovibrionales bacterium]
MMTKFFIFTMIFLGSLVVSARSSETLVLELPSATTTKQAQQKQAEATKTLEKIGCKGLKNVSEAKKVAINTENCTFIHPKLECPLGTVSRWFDAEKKDLIVCVQSADHDVTPPGPSTR